MAERVRRAPAEPLIVAPDERKDNTELLKCTSPIMLFGTSMAPGQPSVVKTKPVLQKILPDGHPDLSHLKTEAQLDGDVKNELLDMRLGLPTPPRISQHPTGASRTQQAALSQPILVDPRVIRAMVGRYNQLIKPGVWNLPSKLQAEAIMLNQELRRLGVPQVPGSTSQASARPHPVQPPAGAMMRDLDTSYVSRAKQALNDQAWVTLKRKFPQMDGSVVSRGNGPDRYMRPRTGP